MSVQNCYTDEQGCRVCDPIPPTPGQPERVEYTPVLGWNAGATGASVLYGDVRLYFGMPAVPPVDAFIGLRSFSLHPATVLSPFFIPFAWRFLSAGGVHYAVPARSGVECSSRIAYDASADTFELRKQGSFVVFLRNNTQVITLSSTLADPVAVTGCLYSSSDALPSCPPS